MTQAVSTIGEETIRSVADRLIGRAGVDSAERIRRGVRQVAERWWAEDGDAEAFASFCDEQLLAGEDDLRTAFERVQALLEQIDGHLYEVRRDLSEPIELDLGPIRPLDHLFAEVDLGAHVDADLFRTKVAFVVLLNFPLYRLQEIIEQGASWDRETWARARMVDRFSARVPAEVLQALTRAFVGTERYVGSYNLRLDRIVAGDGSRPFPEGLRLISHWGLRDELASYYADPTPVGLSKQRLILKVMDRIVRQEIPAAVIDNPELLWDPVSNAVRPLAPEQPTTPELAVREDDRRYAHLLSVFHAVRAVDPYCPSEPTYLRRRFDRDRQMLEGEVEALLVSVLDAPEVAEIGRIIAKRLDRALEPFDLWYSGFRVRGSFSEETLDEKVRPLWPSISAFQDSLPSLLQRLGFAPERAAWLAERIVVDPARGAGHAMQALRREDKAHLRTRIPADGGMDYKSYNVAMHELGHNVEQVFSLNGMDHWWLAGVPNTACTEAFAFAFQSRDLEMLDITAPGSRKPGDGVLGTLWQTFEISGVSLVDMKVWNWLYAHPEATPAELREAVLTLAREVWNRHFAPIFGVRDCEILCIYSHMIAYGLYLPDYAIGHIISFQLGERLLRREAGEPYAAHFGEEVERITRQGRLTPDAWMRGAVGGPISAQALLGATRRALEAA